MIVAARARLDGVPQHLSRRDFTNCGLTPSFDGREFFPRL